MTQDNGATVKVTDAGRDEIARPARGISVGQRRLLQALDIHGTIDGAIAADVVLQRRPLQGDLDRLISLGLIRAAGAASMDVALGTGAEATPLERRRPEHSKPARADGEAKRPTAPNPTRGRIGRSAAVVSAVGAVAMIAVYMSGGGGAAAKHDTAETSSVAGPIAATAEKSPAPAVVVPPVAEPKPVAVARIDTAAAPVALPRPQATPAPRKEPVEAPRAEVAPPVAEKPAAAPPSSAKSEPPAPQVAMQVLPRIPPILKPDPVQAAVKPVEAAPPARKSATLEPGDPCSKLDYPPLALRAEQSGTVVVEVLVDVDGHVTDSKVDRSSGYRILDEAARKGLSRCKFVPANVGGRPEQSWARVEYDWRIDGN